MILIGILPGLLDVIGTLPIHSDVVEIQPGFLIAIPYVDNGETEKSDLGEMLTLKQEGEEMEREAEELPREVNIEKGPMGKGVHLKAEAPKADVQKAGVQKTDLPKAEVL